MIKQFAKRVLVLVLILVMILGYIPAVEWDGADGQRHNIENPLLMTADAADLSPSGSLTVANANYLNITGSNSNATSTGSVSLSGSNITATATGYNTGGCNGTDNASTTTVTVKNNTNYSIQVAFTKGSNVTCSESSPKTLAKGGSFTFTVKSGDGSSSVVSGTMTINSVAYVPFTVTAKSADASMGTASVSPGSITPPSGTATFTATPKTDNAFVAWKNGNTEVSTDNPYSAAITGDTTLTAYFRSTDATVYFANQTGGSYTVTGTGINTSVTSSTQTVKKNENLSVSLSATEDDGYRFAGWYKGDTQLSAANPWSVTLKDYDGQTITAHWEDTNVTTTFVPAEHGSYTVNGTTITSSTPISANYTVPFTWVATPATDYHFVRWVDQTLNVTLSTDATTTRTLNETAGHTVTAEFAYDYITQTFPAVTGGAYSIEGHSVSGSGYDFTGRYDQDYTVTIGALQEWYRFDGWEDGSGNLLADSTHTSYSFRLSVGGTVKPRITFYGLTVTFQPATVGGSYTFTAPNGDPVAVEGSSYTYLGDVTKDYTLTATPTEDGPFTFVAWYDVTADTNLSTANPYTGKLTNGHTYQAKFGRTDTAQYKVGSNYYDYLDLAISAAGSSGKIIVTGNGVVAGSTGQTSFTIPSGVTLVVPYDSNGSVPSASAYKPTFESGSTYNTPSLFKKLTLLGGTTITVNGTLCVNSKMARGGGGTNKAGASSGPYGQIAMESGSSIVVNGTIICYGYITGTGTVTVNSGGQAFEGFQVLDTPGGTHLTALNGNSKGAFLFNQYTVQNVEVPMEIKAGASEKVWTGMYPSTSVEGDATLIGSSAGLFRITSGSVIKSYLPAEDRLQFDLFGNVTLGSINLSISGYNFDTSSYNLPISPRINIFVRSGNATISGHTILLPDSKMAIDQGATFTLNNGKRLLVWDIDDWDSSKYFSKDIATQVKSVVYSPTTGAPAAHTPTRSAEINVNGLLQVTDGYLYTSSQGANIYSGDRTGKTIIQTAYGDYTLSVCVNAERSGLTSGKATYEDVDFTSAQLRNGQPYWGTDKEHIKTGNGSGGTGTFWYTAPTDQWYKFTVDYKYSGNTIFTDYTFNGTSSYTVSGLTDLGASASVGTASVSGETISVTGVTANSVVTVTGTPKEYRPYFILDAKNYGLYQRFTGNTLSDTVTVGDATYYVVQAADGNLPFGSALSAPSDASMGVSAANYNEITWRLADNAAAAVFPGSVPQGEVAQGPVYIYGFYSGYVASVTQSGTTKNYTTLEKAFYTLLNNKTYTVTMLADCDSYEDEDGTASLSVPAGSTVTFDLNGHYAKGKLVNNDTMYLELNGGTFEFQTGATAATAAWKGVAAVMNSGTLTITDSVGGGMITTDAISDTSGTNGSAVIRNNATGILTVTGQADNLLKLYQSQSVNTNNYGIYNLGTINALTNADVYTKNNGTCGLNIYNYNTGVIKLISGGHYFSSGSVSFFNYGGTINRIDGVTVDGKKGLQNQNIRTGAIASGYVVADGDKAIVDVITNSHFEVGQYAINNSATINTLSNSTFIAHPDTAQCDTRGNGLSTASEGNVAANTVYNTANWWYDTNVWKQVDSTSGGYFRTNYYKEEEAYRPTIGEIIDCEIYAENTTTSASYGDYALVNSGGVIGKIGGTTNIKTYKHPDSTATITTSHYAMQNLAGGIIKSIEGTVNISATGIDALQNTGIFTTQIAYTYGNKVGGNVTHQVSTYGDPSTILSVTCAGTWSCGSYYVILNSGYIQTIDAPDLTLKSATSGYNVLYNYMDGANSSLDYYCYYTDNATAGTAYLREATYVRNLEKGGTIGTINGVTLQGKYSVLVNLGHIGTLSNVTVSTLTTSNDPTIVNGDNRVSGVTEYRKDVAHYSSDYPHVTISAGYATRYDREWTYVPATIDVIDNLTLTSTGQYALRNAGHIGTLKNSTITATTNYALHNSASGPLTEKTSVQYYSGTSIWATTKYTSEYAKHYERDPASIDLIDNCTISTGTGNYAAYNSGDIGTIKNSTFTAGETTAAAYALANMGNTELEYTRDCLDDFLYITANAGTACTAYAGSGGETNVVVYDYDAPTIDLIGEGNTFTATTPVIANTGIITAIDSGEGTLTTITGSKAKGSTIYNYSAGLDARTTTTPYTAAETLPANGTKGTAVNDDTLLAGAQIGTIKNIYINANGYGILNGDGTTGKLPVIGEIGEGTEIYAHCTTAGYHAIYNQANAKITSITGGLFKATKATTNAYKNNNTDPTLATLISGGYFQGNANTRANAIYEPDNTNRQTYPTGKKLSTVTTDPTEVNANMSGTYYYINDAYTVTFDMQDHGTAPDSQTIESGQKATEPTAPTADGYRFDGWYKEAACTNAWDFSSDTVTANTTLYAKWTALYTVTWKNGNTTLETDTNVASGTAPGYDGATPTKAADAQYTYTFAGWAASAGQETGTAVGELPAVSGDVTYFAAFSKTVNEYTITWVDGNGETLKTEQVAYGTTPSYSGATPTKTATAQYTYTFNNTWSPAIASVTGAATYTAQFSSTVNEYTITWVDGNGDTLKTEQVAYGTAPSYDGAEPTKAATAQYTYAFAGWATAADQESGTAEESLPAVSGDVTYFAAFSKTVNEYTITWVDGDGVTLKTEQVAYGETPAYSGDTPTKTATAQYTYTFNNSWSPAITPVTGAATYTAQFSSTVNEYTITWVDGNGDTLKTEQVAYGTTPSYSGATPTKTATAQYTYTFNNSWNPAIVPVTGAATYTAQFDETVNTYEITWVDGNGDTLKTEQVAYGQTPAYSGDTPTKTATVEYTYTFNNSWNPVITPVAGAVTYTAQFDATPNGFVVTFYANNGTDTFATQVIGYGVAKALRENTFTLAGYTLKGWNTLSNPTKENSGDFYYDGQTVTLTENLTLYAQWAAAEKINLTFTLNQSISEDAGTDQQTFTYVLGDKLFTPAYTYYHFDSWRYGESTYSTAELQSLLEKAWQEGVSKTFDVEAQFTRETYQVKLNSWIDGIDDEPYYENKTVTSRRGRSTAVSIANSFKYNGQTYYLQYWLIGPDENVNTVHEIQTENGMELTGEGYEKLYGAKSVFFPKDIVVNGEYTEDKYSAIAFYSTRTPQTAEKPAVSLRIVNETKMKVGTEWFVAVTVEAVLNDPANYTVKELGLKTLQASAVSDPTREIANEMQNPEAADIVNTDKWNACTYTYRWKLKDRADYLYLSSYVEYEKKDGTGSNTLYCAYEDGTGQQSPSLENYDVIPLIDNG